MGGAYHRYEEDKDFKKFHKALAARLRAARVEAGFTQDQLAEEIGVSKSVLSKSENASDPQKTPAYIVKKYADISGRNINDFFSDDMPKTEGKEAKIESIRKQLTWFSEEELDLAHGMISYYLRNRKNR